MVKTDNRSILLVVDDEDDIFLLRDFIFDINPEMEFIVYSDGKKVLDALKSARRFPMIVLMDLYIPRKNGFEVLSEIKHTENLKSLRVFLFSETHHEDHLKLAYENGADLFIMKPTSINQMRTLARYLNDVDLTTFEKPDFNNFVFTYND